MNQRTGNVNVNRPNKMFETKNFCSPTASHMNSNEQNPKDTLLIGSLNTCGLKGRIQYPEFVDLVRKYDILCISETKLDHDDVISCEGYTFFNQPRKQSYIRKSGGIGFFVRDNLVKFVTIIDSTSEYISWLKVSKKHHKLSENILIGAVYIPPQQSRFFNDDEYDLFEQEMTSACGNDDYVCILGDFNAQTGELTDFTSADSFFSEHFHFDQQTIDFFDQNCVLEANNIKLNRTSKDKKKNNLGFRLIDICKNDNLFILNGRYGQDRDTGAMTFRDTSVIDYILVSTKTFDILLNFQITDLDRLFSDGHSLLTLTIRTQYCKIQDTKECNTSNPLTFIKPTEYQCFFENFSQRSAEQILHTIQSCNSDSTKDSINSIASQIGDAFQVSAKKVHDLRSNYTAAKKTKNRPWFGYQCQNARKKYYLAKRRHNLYRSAENKNALIKESRSYKKTMNKFINKHKQLLQNKLRKMQKSQPKEYWKFLNSLKNKKKTELPSIAQFHEYFSNIYSSSDDDDELDYRDINFEDSNEFLNCPFTCSEIERCIQKLKNSKTPGGDEILNEYLKLTKDQMLPIYTSFFNLILNTGHVPDQWLEGKIRPIYKNKGDTLDPNNYRPITLLSCLGKLFTAVLNERLNTFLEENDLLKENQAGFRKKYSTYDHIFALYSLIELLKYEKKKLFCCFIDFSKAFDSVWRIGLWRKLINTYVNGNFLRVIQNIYLNIKSCVSLSGEDSPFFFTNRGVRQGDNLSPVLFSLFLNDLEDYLIADRIKGISVDCVNEDLYFFIKVFVLLYADDTVILAESAEELQKSLDSFYRYCLEWKLHVNESKTKIIIFGARRTNSFCFKFDDLTLEIVDSYKYLGTFFSKSRSFLNARKHIAEQARKAMHLLKMRIRNLHLPVDLQLKLFDHTVLPILTYACEIWGFENCGMLELIHTQFLRSIIHARKSTPLYMIYGELGRYPIEIIIKDRMINYWNRLISSKQNKLASLLYQKLRSTTHINSKWILKIQDILEESGRRDIWLNQIPNPNTGTLIKQILKDQYLQSWNTKLEKSSKGLNYRIFKDSINLEQYFLQLPTHLLLSLAKLRTGNHRFPCERGRWQGIELSDRKCTLCNLKEVGDEFHYVLVCPFFKEEREKYIKKYFFLNPNVLKFKELMNCQNVDKLKQLALFVKILVQTVQ